jgi:hypothetical protein
LFSSTKLRSSPPDGSSFSESRASVKSIWTQWAPPIQAAADLVGGLPDEVLDERFARVTGDPVPRV